jgi:hypothetical protein
MPFDPDMSPEDEAALERAWDSAPDVAASDKPATESVDETSNDRLNRVYELGREMLDRWSGHP